MEIKKWLPGLICAASLAVGGATSLQMARGAAQHEALQQPSTAATTAFAKPSCSAPARSASASSDIDLMIKHYYFDHASQFAPVPATPCERAEALRQIESEIRQKMALAKKS
jgi:hypothetical protein